MESAGVLAIESEGAHVVAFSLPRSVYRVTVHRTCFPPRELDSKPLQRSREMFLSSAGVKSVGKRLHGKRITVVGIAANAWGPPTTDYRLHSRPSPLIKHNRFVIIKAQTKATYPFCDRLPF